MPERPPVPPRVAQPPGKTYLQFSPDGQRMLVAGCADYARSFKTNDDGEPDMIDHVQEDTLAIACGNDYAILGAENGTVSEYLVAGENKSSLKDILVRFTLPVRDIALSPNEEWIAVSSDEVEVKVVNRHDIERIFILRDHPKPIKHLSYDPAGKWLAASCTDGKIYMYNVESEQPRYVKAIDGIIQRLETTEHATSRCFWHPNGKTFATATASRETVVVSAEEGEIKHRFAGVHNSPITSIAWSHNARMLATSSHDGLIALWDAKTQQLLQQSTYEEILHITWHNKGENLFCWSNSWGEVYIVDNFLKSPNTLELLKAPLEKSVVEKPNAQPQTNDPTQLQKNGVRPLINGRPRAASFDSLDDFLNAEGDDNWIDDDDGAGYKNVNGKRANGHLDSANGTSKRQRYDGPTWQPRIHDAFQSGSSPWKGNRRYLTLNLTGTVWTVDQSTHNTVTVEFYDRTLHRDFHFTDPFKYDKACLTEHGTLFSCPADTSVTPTQPATLFYRPHETWTNRADFRVSLPDGEDIACIGLSNKYVIACTTTNYVRVYTLYGTPIKIYRLKSSPAVTCAAHGDYLLTVTNGAVNSDQLTQLVYSIDNIKSDMTHQSCDLVALGTPHPEAEDYESGSVTLKSVFWTDTGDPAIYDSTGTLLVLQHWRTMGQAKWIPLLDTRQLERLRGGRKEETYWPVAVAGEKFHCIILKGGDTTPSWPRPLLSEFDLEIPISQSKPSEGDTDMDGEESVTTQLRRLEQDYVRTAILASLLDGRVQSAGDNARHADKAELMRRELEADKILLQLMAAECKQGGEETGVKALEVVGLMKDRSGKLIEAASKIAGRFGRSVLEEKIRELGERRLLGVDDDDFVE